MKIDFITQKEHREEDLSNGLMAYPEVKKAKKKKLKQCEYRDCKVLVHLGKKYCSPHSVDRTNELLRKV